MIEGALFVEPSPMVERVVFIATPHRGSFLAAYGPAQLIGRFVRAPANIVRATTDLISRNQSALAIRTIDDVETSVGNMSPRSGFLRLLASLPIAPGVKSHSIIAVKDLASKEDGSDGVVRYQSAHLDEVDSELVVESGHSCLKHPEVVLEARRILRLHLSSQGRAAPP